MKIKLFKDIFPIRVQRSCKWKFFMFFSAFLLSTNLAQAAIWIGSFSGEQDEFSLAREGIARDIQVETLLHEGDELSVLSEDGVMRLWNDDDDSEIILSKENPRYTVPVSKAPTTLVSNLSTMIEEWLSQTASEKVQTKSLSTRGNEPVLLLGASDWKNKMQQGFTSLVVYWSGGQPPYQVRLIDSDDRVITLKSDIQDNHVTLIELDIPVGEYGLKVLGKSSSSFVQLEVVNPPSLPSIYTKILKSRVPQQIKNKYSVLSLANYSDWIFQSLQLAEQHNLIEVKEQILQRDVPNLIDQSKF